MVNLHKIVRTAINSLHPEEKVFLYQSLGEQNIKGRVIPTYATGEIIKAQIQSLSPDDQELLNGVATDGSSCKAYIFSGLLQPEGISRAWCRAGDMLQRDDGTWWLINKVLEDFSGSGWKCVQIQYQVLPPEGVIGP